MKAEERQREEKVLISLSVKARAAWRENETEREHITMLTARKQHSTYTISSLAATEQNIKTMNSDEDTSKKLRSVAVNPL